MATEANPTEATDTPEDAWMFGIRATLPTEGEEWPIHFIVDVPWDAPEGRDETLGKLRATYPTIRFAPVRGADALTEEEWAAAFPNSK